MTAALIDTERKWSRMSGDLIRRSDAIKALGDAHFKNWGNAVLVIQDIPAIEPKKGKWVEVQKYNYRCSECGKLVTRVECTLDNFCPNCGARMKGEDDE